MNNTLTKVTTIEAVCFIIITTVNKVIFNLPQLILEVCGSSSLLNIIYITGVAIIFTFILAKLFRRFANYDIVDVSEFLGGKILKNIIGFCIIIYLLFFASLLIRNFAEVIHALYYSHSSIFYLLGFFVATTLISNFIGENSIFKVNVVVIIVMFFSLLITFISVSPNIVWQRVLPIFGNGINQTFFSGLCNIYAFNGLMGLYFILPILSEKRDFKKISFISVIIIGLLLFLATACLLLSLSFSTSIKDSSSVYTLISNNEFGSFLQHPESLFVLSWVLSVMSYMNLIILFIVRFSEKLTNIQNRRVLILLIGLIIFIIALLPQNIISTRDYEKFIYSYITIPLLFFIFPSILFLGNIKAKKEQL